MLRRSGMMQREEAISGCSQSTVENRLSALPGNDQVSGASGWVDGKLPEVWEGVPAGRKRRTSREGSADQRRKHQAPSTKHQTNPKSQIPNPKSPDSATAASASNSDSTAAPTSRKRRSSRSRFSCGNDSARASRYF